MGNGKQKSIESEQMESYESKKKQETGMKWEGESTCINHVFNNIMSGVINWVAVERLGTIDHRGGARKSTIYR